jgi:hypothetical protein
MDTPRNALRAASTPIDVLSSSYEATARVPFPAETPRAWPMAVRSRRYDGT